MENDIGSDLIWLCRRMIGITRLVILLPHVRLNSVSAADLSRIREIYYQKAKYRSQYPRLHTLLLMKLIEHSPSLNHVEINVDYGGDADFPTNLARTLEILRYISERCRNVANLSIDCHVPDIIPYVLHLYPTLINLKCRKRWYIPGSDFEALKGNYTSMTPILSVKPHYHNLQHFEVDTINSLFNADGSNSNCLETLLKCCKSLTSLHVSINDKLSENVSLVSTLSAYGQKIKQLYITTGRQNPHSELSTMDMNDSAMLSSFMQQLSSFSDKCLYDKIPNSLPLTFASSLPSLESLQVMVDTVVTISYSSLSIPNQNQLDADPFLVTLSKCSNLRNLKIHLRTQVPGGSSSAIFKAISKYCPKLERIRIFTTSAKLKDELYPFDAVLLSCNHLEVLDIQLKGIKAEELSLICKHGINLRTLRIISDVMPSLSTIPPATVPNTKLRLLYVQCDACSLRTLWYMLKIFASVETLCLYGINFTLMSDIDDKQVTKNPCFVRTLVIVEAILDDAVETDIINRFLYQRLVLTGGCYWSIDCNSSRKLLLHIKQTHLQEFRVYQPRIRGNFHDIVKGLPKLFPHIDMKYFSFHYDKLIEKWYKLKNTGNDLFH
jgi:hypothetical protein